jgi:N-acetylglucosaminyl-diphospho-decaprenol L-rhamnosyltransferase
MEDKVLIIIVNWNTGRLLAACLKALTKLPEASLVSRVIVVDNASTDTSLALAKEVPAGALSFEFNELSSNKGFAAANNLAIKKAKKEHVLLLNPDTEMQPGSLQALVTRLKMEAAVGIVGPKLLNANGSWQPSVRAFPNFLVLVWLMLKLHRVWPGAPWWRKYMRDDFQPEVKQVVDQVMGAVFLIRDRAVQEIGLLDEDYYLWFEEVDYCWRARQGRWQVVYDPAGEVIHQGGTSFKQLMGWQRLRPFLKSSLTYARKNLSGVAYWGLVALVPVSWLLAVPITIFHLWQQPAK